MMSKLPTYFGFRILPGVTIYRPAGCCTTLLLLAFIPAPAWFVVALLLAAHHPHDPLGAAARAAAWLLALVVGVFFWSCFLVYVRYRIERWLAKRQQ